ncbi:MAG: acetyl-CoA carboxylase biotin carboxyl carrier protein [Gemmatimonadales bacterium]
MIDFKVLEKLLELLNSSNAGSIEVRKNLWSTTIRVSKDTAFGNATPTSYQVSRGNPVAASPVTAVPSAAAGAPPAVVAQPAHAGEGEEAPAAAAEAPSAHLVEIKSPMVGTFYAQPEPGADPYVRVGSRVSVGQTLCIVEAMKIMNPIDAEVSGIIKEIAVQDAQPVEFGQVLFRVDPNG